MMEGSSALARIERLKQIQRKSTISSSIRQSDRKRDAQQRAKEESLNPVGVLEACLDNIERLLHSLLKIDFTEEDALVARGVKTTDDGLAMTRVLEEAILSRGVRAPTAEEWIAIKRRQLEDREYEDRRLKYERSRLNSVAHAELIDRLSVHDTDRAWVSSMLDAIDPPLREAALKIWADKYNDYSLPLEGDRYREANLALLRLAIESSPETVKALQRKKPA